MLVRPTLAPLLLVACVASPEPDVTGVDSDDSALVDTRIGDSSGRGDTDVAETDTDLPADTLVVDTDTDLTADTLVVDTDLPADTVVVDTDTDLPVDTLVVDTDRPADTLVVDTDTHPPADTLVPLSDTDSADTAVVGDSDDPGTVVVETDLSDTGVALDRDGDGFTADVDCDDADPAVHPELCDGVPNGCVDGWTPGSEAGLVAFEAADGRVLDLTDAFPRVAPAAEVTLAESGTLWICPGTFHAYVRIAGGADVALRGRGGAAVTTLDADGLGSVVRVVAPLASLDVEGLTLTDGSAPCTYEAPGGDCGGYGGGIAVVATTRRVSVIDAVLTGNVAHDGGGGFFAGEAEGGRDPDLPPWDPRFDEPTWSVGSPDVIRIVRTELSDDIAEWDGGGAWITATGEAVVELEDVRVTGNTGADSRGGGAWVHLVDRAALAIDGATFEGNRAGGRGGRGTTFDDHAMGGGLFVRAETSGALAIRDATFLRNVAVGFSSYAPNRVMGNGGALWIQQSGFTHWYGATYAHESGPITLERVDMEGNVAGDSPTSPSDGRGGGASVTSSGEVTIVDAAFVGNRAGNRTSRSTSLYPTAYNGGGGLYLGRTTALLVRTRIEGNVAGLSGGGLLLAQSDVELDDASVVDNATDLFGQGANVYGASSRLSLAGGALVRGGGGALGHPSVYLDDTTLTCTGSPTELTGVVGYASGGSYDAAVRIEGLSRFTASACDLGEPLAPDDNATSTGASCDLYLGTAAQVVAQGDDATFTCTASGCP